MARGDIVVYDLDEKDIDIILIVDPRRRNPNLTFTPGQVFRYLSDRPQAVVVHRINECDERKGTRLMNHRLRLANYVADHTILIGSWLAGLDVWRRESPHSIILNGADESLFNRHESANWRPGERFRLVTHHWGGHALKGFDVYKRLDAMLEQGEWKQQLEFTYIGNLPDGYIFKNARHLPPLDGNQLAVELKMHHGYITASVNEPAGMHHIEGGLCGLPLLYRDSGALPEYCQGFGEMFRGPDDMPNALGRLLGHYSQRKAAMASYPHTAERMCENYLALFDELVGRRSEISTYRNLWRNYFQAMLIQIAL